MLIIDIFRSLSPWSMYEVVVNNSENLRRKGEFKTASLTDKNIDFVGAASGNESGLDSTSDPALGTLEISPERRRKFELALSRRARRIQSELKFRHMKLSILYFVIKMKILALKVIGYLNGYLSKLGIRIGHDWLL